MLTPRSTLTRRIVAALDASPSRIPVLVGGCGSGRTTLLQQLRERLGRTAALYLDVERTATTPARFPPAPARLTLAAGPSPPPPPPRSASRRRPGPAPRSTRRSAFSAARTRAAAS